MSEEPLNREDDLQEDVQDTTEDPSIAPKIALDAPKLLTMNVGKTPRIISVEKSVKKLTRPKYKTLEFLWAYRP